jgi:tetratricopeptide (TPR) repeat protein
MSNRLDQLKSMHKDDPNDTFVLYALAKEYENLEQHDVSLEIFLKLKNQDPNYIGMYYHLGKLYELLDNNKEALITYIEGLEVGKKLGDFHAVAELNNAKTNLELEM